MLLVAILAKIDDFQRTRNHAIVFIQSKAVEAEFSSCHFWQPTAGERTRGVLYVRRRQLDDRTDQSPSD